MTTTTDTAVERGSGNVFADLGLPDPNGHLLKAELVGRDVDIGIREPRSAAGGKLRIAGAEPA